MGLWIACAQVWSPASTLTRNVAFELHGMRPSTSRRPCSRRCSASASALESRTSVHPRAVMTLDVHRQSAPTAHGPAAGHGVVGGADEGHDLVTREVYASSPLVGHGVGVGLAVLVGGDEFLEHHDGAVVVSFV